MNFGRSDDGRRLRNQLERDRASLVIDSIADHGHDQREKQTRGDDRERNPRDDQIVGRAKDFPFCMNALHERRGEVGDEWIKIQWAQDFGRRRRRCLHCAARGGGDGRTAGLFGIVVHVHVHGNLHRRRLFILFRIRIEL